jgi:ribose-phosphate pyrophosphokinase
LGAEIVECCVRNKTDQTSEIKIEASFDRDPVIIAESLVLPLHTNFMNLLLMIDAIKRNGAGKIHAFIPYFGYGRQDRIIVGGAVPAQLAVKLISASGADDVCCIDTHSETDGIDNILSTSLFAESIKQHLVTTPLPNRAIVLAPDKGSVPRAKQLANLLNLSYVFILKNRSSYGVVSGEVSESKMTESCIIIDDIVDSGATMDYACFNATRLGAKNIIICCTHLINHAAIQTIMSKYPQISRILTTNSVKQKRDLDKLTVLDISDLFARRIVK